MIAISGLLLILLVCYCVDTSGKSTKDGKKTYSSKKIPTKKVEQAHGSWEDDDDILETSVRDDEVLSSTFSKGRESKLSKPKLSKPKKSSSAKKEPKRKPATENKQTERDYLDDTPLIDPVYRIVANYLLFYSSESIIENATPDEIERAISTIATAQSAWKSVDGATHQLKSTLKSSSTSLMSRYKRFIARKSKNTKEAAKLSEYVDLVEHGLHGTEILQPIIKESENSRRRNRFLQEAGVEEIDRFVVTTPDRALSVLVTVLRPIPLEGEALEGDGSNIEISRFRAKELVLVLTDNPQTRPSDMYSEMMRLATEEEPISLSVLHGNKPVVDKISTTRPLKNNKKDAPIATRGASQISVLPSFLHLAKEVMKQLNPILYTISEHSVPVADLDENEIINHPADVVEKRNIKKEISRIPTYEHIRVIGHSCGGSVAAYVAMIADGFMTPSDTGDISIVTSQDSLASGYAGRVRCITYGAMPCVSRSVIPSFVASLMCGDDFVCRLQRESLQRMREKVVAAVASGAGKRGLGWLSGASLLGELSQTASKQIGQYQGRKKENKGMLHLPGRVFYMKSRQLKQGATLQRVLRGNWQEEVMWNIRDLVLSPKMLMHHELESYIRTLSRC